MKKLFYITAHPHDESQSYSTAVGKAFIKLANELDKMRTESKLNIT